MSNYNPKQPTKHVGTNKYITFFVTRNRAPTGSDYRQPETGSLYSIGTVWAVGKDPTTGSQGDLWMLSKIVANVGYWIELKSGSTGTFVPTITGATTAGTTTYTSQIGVFNLIGNLLNFSAQISWSAATGTGIISVGNLPLTISSTINNSVTTNIYTDCLIATATSILLQLPGGGNAGNLIGYIADTGAQVQSALESNQANTIYISGSYFIN